MKRIIALLLYTLSTLFTVALATAHIDNIVKNASIDISKYEQQAQGLTVDRKSSIKRLIKLIKLSQARLSGSSNQSQASWQETNQRYLVLLKHLDNLVAENPVQADTQSESAAKTSSSANSASSQTQTVQPLVSGQRVRVKKLARDMDNLTSSITSVGPSFLQDKQQIAALTKKFNQFKSALARYPQLDDPDVQLAQQAFVKMQQRLSAEHQRAQSQLKTLGDVQQRLAAIDKLSQEYPVPKPMKTPFTAKAAKLWMEAASQARTVAERQYPQLIEITELAWLPNNPGTPQTGAPYDSQDVGYLTQGASARFAAVQENYQIMLQTLKLQFDNIKKDVLSRWQVDPKGEDSYQFTGTGNQEQAFELYDNSIAIANSSIYLQQTLGKDDPAAAKLVNLLQQAKEQFANNRRIAIQNGRLPEPQSTDSALLAIAKSILEKPEYKFGEFGPIVLTTKAVVTREKKSSNLKIDDAEITLSGDLKLSGTETTWTYKWQEFKFASPLKDEDGGWRVWWIVAKNFSSGGNKTPLNRWISGEVTQGHPILEENF